MLSRRIATARPLRVALPIARRTAFGQQRGAAQAGPEYLSLVSGDVLLWMLLETAC